MVKSSLPSRGPAQLILRRSDSSVTARKARFRLFEPQWSTCRCMAITEPAWRRHEQQTVAAVLATVTHHSHSKVSTVNAALRGQKTGNGSRVGLAEYYEFSSDDGRPTGGERLEALLEPWPQGKIERHDGIAYELVQALDVPVPQMGEQLLVVAEPVIEVPKILPLDVPLRRLCRDTQLAEQLVEVPTIVSYSSLQRTVEHPVDIPVPGREGRASGLQGFLPGLGSTAWRSSQKRISEQIVEQIVGIPGGGLQDFRPRQSSSSSSHVPVRAYDAPGFGFFSHFSPKQKKVRHNLRTRGLNCEPMDAGCS